MKISEDKRSPPTLKVCRAVYVWNADRAAKPIIRAVVAFKNRTGRLPTTLSDLAETNRGKALKLEGHNDVGLVWSVNYRNNFLRGDFQPRSSESSATSQAPGKLKINNK